MIKWILILMGLVILLYFPASAQFVGHPSRVDCFTFDDEPAISVGTDDSVYIQYPIATGNYDHVWLHYNNSSLDDQYDTLIFITRTPIWFTGWDSITYNYATHTTDSTASSIRATEFKRTADGGTRTDLFIGPQAKSASVDAWTHVNVGAQTITGGNWLGLQFVIRVDHNDSVWHDKPYVWGKRQ